ncbi:MAG: phage major tail tube protein [Lachnospiraceae bacterium]|nr:phage major tail tube protein [Lachnospiraceae bacterium]
MANSNVMPELINNYQIFNDAKRLLGVSGEVELPNLESLTESLEVAGALGELEVPATGQYKSIKLKIPFAILYDDVFDITDTTEAVKFTLRASEQFSNSETYNTDYKPMKIVVRGKPLVINLGKLAKGKKGEPHVELEIYYIKIVIDGVTELELDKMGFKFVLHGKDMLAKIRKQVGL